MLDGVNFDLSQMVRWDPMVNTQLIVRRFNLCDWAGWQRWSGRVKKARLMF